MILVIVESPFKCPTISKYLGKDYKVVASIGHIRDLAVGNKDHYLGVDVENHFQPIYEISPNKKKTVASLKKAAEAADEVYLATDPDREGEAISYHLAEVLNLDIDKTKRLEFHEITKNAIQNAINNTRNVDMNLVHSQETRRIIDRIIGFDLSHLMQKKINSMSAGRVQSVVLKMIVDREKEINDFKEETYYLIKGSLKIDNAEVPVTLLDENNKERRISSLEEANKIIEELKENPISIASIEDKEMKSHSYPVYTTSTLLQDASTLLKFDSKRTTKVAQKLYEGIELEKGKGPVGLITYMRTDSVRVSPLFISLCKKNIESEYGSEYVGVAKTGNSGDNVQDAHEGIRPTDINVTPEMVEATGNADEAKLYKLIYTRAKASMMKDEIYLHTEINFQCNDLHLQAVSEKTTFDGFTREYKKIRENKRETLPVEITKDSKIDKKKFTQKESHTKPKSRYSEATLIDAMKKEGIGRPSTYAATIDVIKKRKYVTLNRGYFSPTLQGNKTIELLDEWFEDLINIKYTSEMETLLDQIAEDKMQEETVLQDFYDKFIVLLKNAKAGIAKEEVVEEKEDLGNCPLCGKPLVKRNGRYGQFVACSGYPNCKYIPANESKVGKPCPKCKEGVLKLRKSKFGKFYGCSNYPKCDYTEK